MISCVVIPFLNASAKGDFILCRKESDFVYFTKVSFKAGVGSDGFSPKGWKEVVPSSFDIPPRYLEACRMLSVKDGEKGPWQEKIPSRQVVTPAEFRPLLASQAGDLPLLVNGLLESSSEQWTQRQLHHLYQATSELEGFLDAFHAKQSQEYFKVRELVAFVRWISAGISPLMHLYSRLPSYPVVDPEWTQESLSPQVQQTALKLGKILEKTMQGLRDEWVRAGLLWPDGSLRLESLSPGKAMQALAADRVQVAAPASGRTVGARQAGQFLALAQSWAPLSQGALAKEDQSLFMARYCTEVIARRAEAQAHNFQSTYDTYVAGTEEEATCSSLPLLRGISGVVLHLCEMVTPLTHLFERHDIFEKEDESKELFHKHVDQKLLMEIIINSGVLMAYECLLKGLPVAEKVLEGLTDQGSCTLEIPPGISLHARPLSLIVSVVQHHGTPVEMEIDGGRTNAASMMQLLIALGTHPHPQRVTFFGDSAPLADLRHLFEANLGEGGLDQLPRELSYLRLSS